MRVLVIGSNRFESPSSPPLFDNSGPNNSSLFEAASQIGSELAKRTHTILICSQRKDTVDLYVFQGARKGSDKAPIEVHIPDTSPDVYESEIRQDEATTLRRHMSPDMQVVHMEAMAGADALIVIGGSTRSARSAIAAYMLGKTVIPVGSFPGAGREVWAYSSSRRDSFYKGGLSDAEIDKLAEPWKGETSAKFIVDALDAVRRASVRQAVPRSVLVAEILIMLTAMAAWVGFIGYGYRLISPGARAVGLIFASVCFAGLIGSSLKGLFELRNGRPLSQRDVTLDVALGLGAGFVSAILYLVLQLAVTGTAHAVQDENDYVRVALLVSLVAIFAGMYLDTAFANFENVKGSVFSGEYGKKREK